MNSADEQIEQVTHQIKRVLLRVLMAYIVLTIITGIAISNVILRANDMDSITLTSSEYTTTFKLGIHETRVGQDGKEYISATFNSEYGSIKCNIPIEHQDQVKTGVSYDADIVVQSISQDIAGSNSDNFRYIESADFLFSDYMLKDEVDQELVKGKLIDLSELLLDSNSTRVFSKADEVRIDYLLAVKNSAAGRLRNVITVTAYIVLAWAGYKVVTSSLLSINVKVDKR